MGPTLNFFLLAVKKIPNARFPELGWIYFSDAVNLQRFGILNKDDNFYNWLSVVMAIKLHKCDHFETKSFMSSERNLKLIEEVFKDCHNVDNHEAFENGYSIKWECKTELNSNKKLEVENFLTVREIVDKFNIIFEEVYKI